MKRLYYSFAACLLIAGGVAIVSSCNQEDDYDDFECNLDVTHHTSLRRSSANDLEPDQGGGERYEMNTYFPQEENCCYFAAIVREWIRSKGTAYFLSKDCNPNAAQYYEKLKRDFKYMYPDWNVGDSVTSSQFENYIKEKCSLMSETQNIDNARDYFSNKDNIKKVSAIIVKKSGETNDHVAHFVRYKSGYVYYAGEDIVGNGNSRMNVDGENGWTIYGVVLK